MRDSLYMAWQYLRRHKGTSAILAASMTLIFFLPSALLLVVEDATEHFRSRAASTPLLVGARGSELELVLGSLYFDEPQPEVMRLSELERIEELELGDAIPLHIVMRSGNIPIVGTTSDYHLLRKLRLCPGSAKQDSRRVYCRGEGRSLTWLAGWQPPAGCQTEGVCTA